MTQGNFGQYISEIIIGFIAILFMRFLIAEWKHKNIRKQVRIKRDSYPKAYKPVTHFSKNKN